MQTILVDWNGVLDQYAGWKGSAEASSTPPAPGAREFLQALGALGYRVVVFTTAEASGVWAWLRAHDLHHFVFDVTNEKVPAWLIVDDRAVCHRGDFDATLAAIQAFQPHWQGEAGG